MNAQQIAETVNDQYKYQRQYPVSGAQKQVLAALGITVKLNGSSHADQIFEALGIVVSSRREGRNTIPVVKAIEATGRAANADEDIAANHIIADLSAIAQWM